MKYIPPKIVIAEISLEDIIITSDGSGTAMNQGAFIDEDSFSLILGGRYSEPKPLPEGENP